MPALLMSRKSKVVHLLSEFALPESGGNVGALLI